MKQLPIAIGIILVIVAISAMFIDDDVQDSDIDNQQISIASNTHQNVKQDIRYEQDAKIDTQSRPEELEPEEEQEKSKEDKSVIYSSVDQSRRYAVQVIDESEPESVGGKTFTIRGTVDGGRFVLKIPEKLKYSPLKLKVINLKTKETKNTELTFLTELQSGAAAPELAVEFNDIDNYQVMVDDRNSLVFP